MGWDIRGVVERKGMSPIAASSVGRSGAKCYGRATEGVSTVASRSLTSEYSLVVGATNSLGVLDRQFLLDAFVADRRGMRGRPTIGQQIRRRPGHACLA